MGSIYHQILNLKEYFRLYDEADALPDPQERQMRNALLDAVSEAITDYDVHVREYEYRMHCCAVAGRGLVIKTVSGSEVKNRWDELFAAGISDAEKAAVYFDQFRWHLLSYGKRPCLTGEAAETAFDECQKGNVLVFFQHTDEAYCIENAGLIYPRDFDVEVPSPYNDVYLFDPKNRWCYIRTHEPECGPYFIES